MYLCMQIAGTPKITLTNPSKCKRNFTLVFTSLNCLFVSNKLKFFQNEVTGVTRGSLEMLENKIFEGKNLN